METIALADDLSVLRDADELSLEGELTAANAMVLLNWLEQYGECRVLHLGELDIADGVACTHAVNAVRLLLARSQCLVLAEAPQVLAHNLYRTGLLGQGGIVLRAMREDEAYG